MSDIDKMREATEQARDATRELHAAMKDTRALLKECRDERERIETSAIALTREVVVDAVKQEFENMQDQLRVLTQRAYDKIRDQMQSVVNESVYGHPKGAASGNPSVFDVVVHLREAVMKMIRYRETGWEMDQPVSYEDVMSVFFPGKRPFIKPRPRPKEDK